MAFSGTISQTVFTTRKVIDNAFRRCKVPAETITSEHISIANDQLYLLMSDLPNKGLLLWTIEKELYPFYEGVPEIVLNDGTIDVLNSNIRTLQPVTGSNVDTSTTRTITFSSDTTVTCVGIKWSAAAVPIAIERSDDGSTWETVQTETPVASAGQWTWYDLDSFVASLYLRVRATTGTLGFSQIYTGNTPSEIPFGRLNRDSYTALPNHAFISQRPTDFWFDRQVRNPVMRLWPVPDASTEDMQAVVWRKRYLMDVGSMQQELEVPQRWYQAVVSLLSERLAYEITEVDPGLIPLLANRAEADLNYAQQEEYDDSPIMIAPNISQYTV